MHYYNMFICINHFETSIYTLHPSSVLQDRQAYEPNGDFITWCQTSGAAQECWANKNITVLFFYKVAKVLASVSLSSNKTLHR